MSERSPMRVLYLDDDELLRRVMARVAPGMDVELSTVANVVEARAALVSGRFNLVICDFYLGVSKEDTSAEFVRALVAAGVPTIVVTGSPEQAELELGGVVEVLPKPLRSDRLRALVSHAACRRLPSR